MKKTELSNVRLKDGTILNCAEVWLSPTSEGVALTVCAPLKVLWPSGTKITLQPYDKASVSVVEGSLKVEKVDHIVPGLTKERGMSLAYESQVPDRENFEALLYHLCCTTPPTEILSANEVWAFWRNLKWPEPAKRGFAGPAMQAAEKRGWTEFVGLVENTAGNSHSKEPNRGYKSRIFDPKFSEPAPVLPGL